MDESESTPPPVPLAYQTPAHTADLRSRAERARAPLWLAVGAATFLLLASLWNVRQFGPSGLLICLLVPLGLAGGAAWVIAAMRTWGERSEVARRNVRWLACSAAVVLLSLVLGLTSLVPRVCFWASRPSMQAAAVQFRATRPLPPPNRPSTAAGHRFGLYSVDKIGYDSAGGVWFRTDTGTDWIDTISYGFYQSAPGTPPPASSPFGGKDLRLKPLGGGWSWFEANNDYF